MAVALWMKEVHVVERMDQLAEAIGHALTGKVQGDGNVHCDRCNSQVEIEDLLVRDWSQRLIPTCPNCGSHIDVAGQQPIAEEAVAIESLPGEEVICAHCGGEYRSLVVDVRSDALRPTRFCPHCGHATGAVESVQ